MRRRVWGGRGGRRKGGLAVIFALFLPVFIGMIALAVDVAVIATAQGQINTAADAAAQAGARQLFTDNHLTYNPSLTSEISAATSNAASIATSNKILGTAPVVYQAESGSNAADITVGYLDMSSTTSSIAAPTSTSLYNAVQVKVARDANHGGPVPALFARLLGSTGTSVSSTSVAVAQNYSVGSFSSSSGLNANILPIALDLTTYNAMIAGNPSKLTTTGLPIDQYAYNPSTGAVTSGSDGIYESCLYPVSNGSPGNWGTVKIGVSNNSTSTLSAQIRYGITPAQMQAWAATFPNGQIAFSSATSPPSMTLRANPGISAGLKSSIDAIIGQTRLIPIYSAVSGNGNNTTYTIVKFAGVRVMADNFQGNPKYVIVQPALVSDPTATPSTVESSWTSGGLITLRLVR
jgi:Flp pilus assembly protein TadG